MSKKESVNTFKEGLIQDLNPLTTPNNVLTDCLNGTFVTYNGNELTLQNDMGNGKVGTAFLPKGYIPIGMKEHGGIIYVASYNPISKKSQLGSFPSPQQLFNGEDLNVNDINFNFNNLVQPQGNLLNIKAEYYKEKLFTDSDTGVAKKFHPGDRFIITIDSISEEIKQAANLGVINFRLGVLNSKGNIDYIDDSKLKLYNEPTGYWIFCYTNNKTTEEILKDTSLVQVFSAPSSGELLLIIEYKTISAFNLIRQYSFDEGIITVKLFGDMQSSVPTLNGTTLENSNLGLVMDNTIKSEITLQGTSSTKITNKEIAPASVYGVLDRLKKIINIDFSTIKPNAENSQEWRYYITDTYVKIGWSYDYYNVDINQQVSKIVFTFIDFTKSDSNLEDLTNEYSVDIIKEYYNGSFEEVFSFNERLKKNWIYIVRIDRYINNEKSETPYYRLLYTGTLFNQYYSSELNYNNLSQEVKTVPYKLNVNTKIISEDDFTYSVSTPSTSGFIDTIPTVNMFRQSIPSLSTNTSSYRYIVKKNKTYKIESAITSDFDYDNSYAGQPNKENLVKHIQDNIIGTFGEADESDLSYSDPKSFLNASIDVTTTKSELTLDKNIENDVGTLVGTISTNRSIISKAGSPRDDSYSKKSLVPYYYTNMPTFDERKVIGFTEETSYIRCIAGTEDRVEYNGKLSTTGQVQSGTSAGADDAAMYTAVANMGNATVNVWAGYGGDDASIGWDDITRIDNIDGWKRGEKSNEIDVHDNWVIAVWKTVEGGAHPINLASQRTAPRQTSSTRTLIRTDVMLKCYLSQLLIVNTTNNKQIIVGADANSYTFHNVYNTKVPMNISLNTSNKVVDFYLTNDNVSINDRMQQWMSKIPELNNYLPVFQISDNIQYEEEISVGSDINLASDSLVLDCYTNAYSVSVTTVTSDLDENRIYLGIPSGVANSDGTMPLQTDTNGEYLYRDKDNVISDWRNRESVLNYNINDRFTIQENGDFREILVRQIGRHTGRWYKAKNQHAPDILAGIHFGRTKLYNE